MTEKIKQKLMRNLKWCLRQLCKKRGPRWPIMFAFP